MGRAAVEAARAIGYVGAGTVEFIASAEPRLKGFWFMEMNTRLQVEHPVTEAITGFDLVEWQFRIADGESIAVRQDEVPLNGHAVEARLYAEDPDRGFLPSPGRIVALDLPHGEGIRVDAGVAAGLAVPPDYDPMIAKVIAHGATRDQALDRLAAALDDTIVIGPRVNTPFLRALVTHPRFRAAKFDTGFIDAHLPELIAADPAEAAQAAADGVLYLIERERRHAAQRGAVDAPVSDAQAFWPSPWAVDDGFSLGAPRRLTFATVVDGAAREAVATWGPDGAQVSVDGATARHSDRIFEMGEAVIVAARRPHRVAFKRADATGGAPVGEDAARAPMNGKVIAVLVAPGQAVKLGARVAVMEAMKMEHSLTAPRDGTVAEIATVGAQVAEGDAVVNSSPRLTRPAPPRTERDEGSIPPVFGCRIHASVRMLGAAALLPLPACGERVGVRGRFRESEPPRISSDAQTRGEAPSPGSLTRSDLSPHAGRGNPGRSGMCESRSRIRGGQGGLLL